MNANAYYRPVLPVSLLSNITHSLHNPVAMLFGLSSVTLSDYELSRLNFASNARKQMLALMDGMVDNLAEARAARWVLELRREE